MLWQPPLPDHYTAMTHEQLVDAITARRAELGDKVVILGHHYQQDDVIDFADFTGDSFKLSQLAAQRVSETGAQYVIFCGVHFMAESADILTPDDTTILLPDASAGCSMADMADAQQTLDAWETINEVLANTNSRVIPICYMNCSAAIKSFCGEHGGAVCTSSNCQKILDWALAGGDQPLEPGQTIRILFLPDQHLGRNTAAAMGFDIKTQMTVWDPMDPAGMGGNTDADIQNAVFYLWKGHCSVHQLFRPEHIQQIRAQWPGVQVITHPECCYEVCELSDMTGSTEGIKAAIENSPAGSRWAVGTEINMVNRLAGEAAKRGVEVRMLSGCQCLCTTMYRIDMPHLLWTMDQLAQGTVVNAIKVHSQVKHWAIIALQRMLDLTQKQTVKGVAR